MVVGSLVGWNLAPLVVGQTADAALALFRW